MNECSHPPFAAMASKEEFSSEAFSFSHATLGSVTGITRTSSVVQFRSIPYGRVPARFRQSVAVDMLQSHERDCTEYGPSCPQIRQPTDAVGGPLLGENPIFYDEQRCLNLTVTAPREVLQRTPGQAILPVMVHIHGGAFKEGSYITSVRGTRINLNLRKVKLTTRDIRYSQNSREVH